MSITNNKNLAIGVVLASLSWTTLHAAEFRVNTFYDELDRDLNDGVCLTRSGTCSLRAAIMQANKNPDADVIILRAGTYGLYRARAEVGGWDGELNDRQGDFDIRYSVTIRSETLTDPSKVIIHGRSYYIRDRIFHIKGADQSGPIATLQPIKVTLQGLTLLDAAQPVEMGGGGAILIAASRSGLGAAPQVTLKNVVIKNNMSPITGSGLANWGGDVVIEDSVIQNNASTYSPNLMEGFQIDPTPVLIQGGGMGGGIAHWGGSMTLRRVVVTGNASQFGGGIYVQDTYPAATLLIEDSSISQNISFMGAGIASFAGMISTNYGLSLVRTTITNNDAELAGGGIYNAGALLVSNSTLSGNRAWDGAANPQYPGKGGGLYNIGRIVDIVNSTIAGNEAEEVRVVAANINDAKGGDEIFFDYLNVANNSAAGGMAYRFTIKNSIIGDGLAPTNPLDPAYGTVVDDNCNGPTNYMLYITSEGGNTDTGTTCLQPTIAAAASFSKAMTVSTASATDLIGVSAAQLALGPLTDNGSFGSLPDGTSLLSRALGSNSVAVGNAQNCPGSDGRNYGRLDGCDSGAYQVSVDTSGPGNAAPLANPDVTAVNLGKSAIIDVVKNDSDPDAGDSLQVISVSAPTVGEITVEGGKIIYTAPTASEQMVGGVLEATLTYTLSDGQKTSIGSVTIWVYDPSQNTPPVGGDDQFVVGQDQASYLDVLANDSDVDLGDSAQLRIYSAAIGNASSNSSTTTTLPGGSTVTNTNTITLTNEVTSVDIATPHGELRLLNDNTLFRYTPHDGFVGVDEFTYDLVDPRGLIVKGVKVKVTVNQSPAIIDESGALEVDAGGEVAGSVSATDAENDELHFFGSNGSKGIVEIDGTTGEFVYLANENMAGEDEFTVSAFDGFSVSSVVIRVNVIPGSNTAPTAVADILQVLAGQPFDVSVTENDIDIDAFDEGNLKISGEVIPLSEFGGVVEVLNDKIVRFTPDDGFTGQYQFKYRIVDTQGVESDYAIVTLDVRDNLPSEFLQSRYDVVVQVGDAYTGQVKARDGNADAVSYAVTQPQKGSLSFNEITGQFTYVAGNTVGAEEITILATDGYSESSAVIAVTIQAKSSVAGLGGGNSGGGDGGGSSQGEGGGGIMSLYVLFGLVGLALSRRRACA